MNQSWNNTGARGPNQTISYFESKLFIPAQSQQQWIK